MKYIDVVIDNKSQHTDVLYTYGCKWDEVQIGQKVYVPFARGNKIREAYVVRIADTLNAEYKKLKYVEKLDEEICLNQEMIETCMWMKHRYLCKHIDAIKCFTPSGSKSKRGKLRNPFKDAQGDNKPVPMLNEQQSSVIQTILEAIKSRQHHRFLLHGVTGSGKTEVYMQAAKEVLEQGRQVIMLVPEISLTTQIIQRFIGRFGAKRIAVLHSKLSLGERFDEWMRIRNGEVDIVIGARSAVFAPLENLGMIVLDEEHESTYKSDMTPKYDTVEVALKRLQSHKGILLCGSATPSVVTFYRADQGIYRKLQLTERYNQVALPNVSVVDMRQELKNGNRSVISQKLFDEMERVLERKEQVILFLNRRGYSTFISCRECGKVLECPNCGVSLTYHKENDKAICHYCGHEEKPPSRCTECGSKYIRYFGTGTEKVAEAVSELFPEAIIERLDLDAARKKGSVDRILNRFQKGRIDILIGTQLVAKGLDFRNVSLVGVVSADVTLHIPDFRSPERTFQLITQAAGRAGRGDLVGRVIIQSYTPDNYAVAMAAKQDYQRFYETELQLRKLMGYPPFSDLFQILFSSEHEMEVQETASYWYRETVEKLSKIEGIQIFKPQPAPMNKIKETHRFSMLIKCPQGKRRVCTEALDIIKENDKSKKKKCVVTVDVNPYSFA